MHGICMNLLCHNNAVVLDEKVREICARCYLDSHKDNDEVPQ